jgi:hypothetical protein
MTVIGAVHLFNRFGTLTRSKQFLGHRMGETSSESPFPTVPGRPDMRLFTRCLVMRL